jgi:hypothetical protein
MFRTARRENVSLDLPVRKCYLLPRSEYARHKALGKHRFFFNYLFFFCTFLFTCRSAQHVEKIYRLTCQCASATSCRAPNTHVIKHSESTGFFLFICFCFFVFLLHFSFHFSFRTARRENVSLDLPVRKCYLLPRSEYVIKHSESTGFFYLFVFVFSFFFCTFLFHFSFLTERREGISLDLPVHKCYLLLRSEHARNK